MKTMTVLRVFVMPQHKSITEANKQGITTALTTATRATPSDKTFDTT